MDITDILAIKTLTKNAFVLAAPLTVLNDTKLTVGEHTYDLYALGLPTSAVAVFVDARIRWENLDNDEALHFVYGSDNWASFGLGYSPLWAGTAIPKGKRVGHVFLMPLLNGTIKINVTGGDADKVTVRVTGYLE